MVKLVKVEYAGMTAETMREQERKVAEVSEVMAADGQAPRAFSALAL